MPTSYTTSLRLALPATGENNGTWGSLVNTSITQLIEDAVAGYVSVAMTDADYTLSTANGAADEARCMYVNMTGTLTQARNVICPTAEKLYFFRNNTTGGYAVTLKTSAGTGISVPNGKATILLCDGTNVVDASTHFSSLTLTTALGAASGGTGLSSYTAGDLPYATGTTTLAKLGIGTNNYVLTSSGSAPQWTANTGTGSVVRATSPTLVTPALGTPASGTLTSCTGLPISTGVSGLGTGVATFLGTPSSANLAAAVTDETGSGALVFGTSPSLTTPTIAGATLSGTLAGTPTFSGATVTFTNAVAVGSLTVGGSPVSGGAGWVLLDTQTASSSSALNFTTGLSSTYSAYVFVLVNVLPSSNFAALWAQTSTDGGSSYASTSGDYVYGMAGISAGSGAFNQGNATTATSIVLTTSSVLNDAASGGVSGSVYVYAPSSTSVYKQFTYQTVSSATSSVEMYSSSGAGSRKSTSAINAIRFLFSSGDITSGTIRLYGLRNS